MPATINCHASRPTRHVPRAPPGTCDEAAVKGKVQSAIQSGAFPQPRRVLEHVAYGEARQGVCRQPGRAEQAVGIVTFNPM